MQLYCHFLTSVPLFRLCCDQLCPALSNLLEDFVDIFPQVFRIAIRFVDILDLSAREHSPRALTMYIPEPSQPS